jgi:multimeric flavodoxin WrbA
MKILAISGSNRKGGSSYSLLSAILDDQSAIKSRVIQVANMNVQPCELCFDQCAEKPFECILKDDLDIILNELRSADGIMIACPFYFYIPSKFQALLERISCLDYITREKHGKGLSPLADKPCALICISASGSTFNAFQILHHLQEFALMLGMRVVPSGYWPYLGLSVKSGELEKKSVLQQPETLGRAKELRDLLVEEIGAAG